MLDADLHLRHTKRTKAFNFKVSNIVGPRFNGKPDDATACVLIPVLELK